MRLFLAGFMGSGKSYIGTRLARELGMPFIDLDHFIEERAGTSIASFFSTQGEQSFRQLEASVLRTCERLPLFVMATGGGTPCFHENMAWMNDAGTTVFIDPSPEIIAGRLRAERDKRPLLHGDEDVLSIVYRMLGDRRECYERAKIHFCQDDPNADVVRLLAERLAQKPS